MWINPCSRQIILFVKITRLYDKENTIIVRLEKNNFNCAVL